MDRRITEEVKDIACRPERGGNWTTCSSLHRHGYPSFDPILYSLDLILPVISTQQTKDWAPLTTTPCREITWSGRCQHSLEEEVMSNTSGYWWPAGVLFWLCFLRALQSAVLSHPPCNQLEHGGQIAIDSVSFPAALSVLPGVLNPHEITCWLMPNAMLATIWLSGHSLRRPAGDTPLRMFGPSVRAWRDRKAAASYG